MKYKVGDEVVATVSLGIGVMYEFKVYKIQECYDDDGSQRYKIRGLWYSEKSLMKVTKNETPEYYL